MLHEQYKTTLLGLIIYVSLEVMTFLIYFSPFLTYQSDFATSSDNEQRENVWCKRACDLLVSGELTGHFEEPFLMFNASWYDRIVCYFIFTDRHTHLIELKSICTIFWYTNGNKYIYIYIYIFEAWRVEDLTFRTTYPWGGSSKYNDGMHYLWRITAGCDYSEHFLLGVVSRLRTRRL